MDLFNCGFRSGRTAAAPQLKRTAKPSAQDAAHVIHENLLLHLHGEADLECEYPQAIVQDEQYGETDHTPEDELADAVPVLA